MLKQLKFAVPLAQVLLMSALFMWREFIPKGDTVDVRLLVAGNLIIALQFPLVFVLVLISLMPNLFAFNVPVPTEGYSLWLFRITDLVLIGISWHFFVKMIERRLKGMESLEVKSGIARIAMVTFFSCCTIGALLYGVVEGERWIGWLRRQPTPILFTTKVMLLAPEVLLLGWAIGFTWLVTGEIGHVLRNDRQN